MTSQEDRVFVLEIDGRSILAFGAKSLREAQQLTKESWLKEDLGKLASDGVPVWQGSEKMSVRQAMANEMSLFWQTDKAADDSEDLTLAYLIEIDSPSDPAR